MGNLGRRPRGATARADQRLTSKPEFSKELGLMREQTTESMSAALTKAMETVAKQIGAARPD